MKKAKADLRQYYLNILKQQNQHILHKINEYDFKILLAYIPLKTEVNIIPAIEDALFHGITVAVPTQNEKIFAILDTDWKENLIKLSNGTQSIKTDKLLDISLVKEKTLILVPGISFTNDGKRLGRGSGFYDRVIGMTENHDNFVIKGVCTPSQIAENIPFEETDKKVSSLIICQ